MNIVRKNVLHVWVDCKLFQDGEMPHCLTITNEKLAILYDLIRYLCCKSFVRYSFTEIIFFLEFSSLGCQSSVYSYLTPSDPGIGSGFTSTLTRLKRLLRVRERLSDLLPHILDKFSLMNAFFSLIHCCTTCGGMCLWIRRYVIQMGEHFQCSFDE